MINEEVFEIMRRNAFHGDGAVVIDGVSGKVIASGWFVGDISKGGRGGGARTQSAKAIAQQAGGCYVIKCSEDSTGQLNLHFGAVTGTDSNGQPIVELKSKKFNGDLRTPGMVSTDSTEDVTPVVTTLGTEVKRLLELKRLLPWAEFVKKLLEREKIMERTESEERTEADAKVILEQKRKSRRMAAEQTWDIGTQAI